MIQPLTNYVSKILFKDTDTSYAVVAYCDFDKELTKEDIRIYLNTIVEKNEILKRRIIEKDSQLYIEVLDSIDIEEYYTIDYTSENEFLNKTTIVLNEPFKPDAPWQFRFYIDSEAKKSRGYFKIHHAYADGYQLSKTLVSPYTDKDITKQFKRVSTIFNTIYYYIVGTISLCIMNLQFILKVISSNVVQKESEAETDHIESKGFSLEKIKEFTKKHSITVNDFLYSVMIKTDYLYTGKGRILTSVSPINISGTKDINNICPLFLRSNTDQSNSSLLKSVHEIFNSCKYSLFIPCLTLLVNTVTNWLSDDTLYSVYSSVTSNYDYAYSNMICPESNDIDKGFFRNINNIHFLSAAKNREIIVSCISYKDTIHIMYSFKKGSIKDKARFEQCVYDAYDSLIKTYDADSPLGP